VEDKETEWQVAAFGMTGLETALRVVHAAMVDTGLLDWAGVADRMSVRPAAIGQLDGSVATSSAANSSAANSDAGDGGGTPSPFALLHGRPLEPGSPANLVLYDPAARSVVDPELHASRSRNTPFAGRELPGQVIATFLRGEPTVLDGKLAR
jgi:dihydroorotase